MDQLEIRNTALAYAFRLAEFTKDTPKSADELIAISKKFEKYIAQGKTNDAG